MEILNELIEKLLSEEKELQNRFLIPKDEETKKQLFRALCNIRKPGYNKYIDEHWLKLQDAYLAAELEAKGGAVCGDSLKTVQEQFQIPVKPMYLQKKTSKSQPFTLYHSDKVALYQGDITRLAVDAIVNGANSQMLGCFVPNHKCVDNAIHSAAGIQLRQECYELMKKQGYPLPNGFAKITKGYNLPCKYVLHTVGPMIYENVTDQDETELRSCYDACLGLAEEYQLETVAFCCISTGEFHFPKAHGAGIAIEAVDEFMDSAKYVKKVIFDVYTKEDYAIYETLFKKYN